MGEGGAAGDLPWDECDADLDRLGVGEVPILPSHDALSRRANPEALGDRPRGHDPSDACQNGVGNPALRLDLGVKW